MLCEVAREASLKFLSFTPDELICKYNNCNQSMSTTCCNLVIHPFNNCLLIWSFITTSFGHQISKISTPELPNKCCQTHLQGSSFHIGIKGFMAGDGTKDIKGCAFWDVLGINSCQLQPNLPQHVLNCLITSETWPPLQWLLPSYSFPSAYT